MHKLVKEKIAFDDNTGIAMPKLYPSGLWARTEVIGGYDLHVNPNGKSSLGEVIFKQHNVVPIGGVSYVMQKLFDVPETQITIPTLYDLNGIGLANSLPMGQQKGDTYYLSPSKPTDNYHRYPVYRPGHYVQLFGVGNTGVSENDVNVYKPDYRENAITISRVTTDNQSITGTMLPFRYTDGQLSITERRQYFGVKTDTNGIKGYYLKRFDQDPVIKHAWKTGEDYDELELIKDSEVWTNLNGINSVESFAEIILKITKKDIKEWYIKEENEDGTRINTIALFDGEYVKDPNNQADDGDYRDVRMFSKLVIHPEYLNLNKELDIIYRVYGS